MIVSLSASGIFAIIMLVVGAALASGGCPLPDGERIDHDVSGKLLDGTPKSGHHSAARGLAEGCTDSGIVAGVRPS